MITTHTKNPSPVEIAGRARVMDNNELPLTKKNLSPAETAGRARVMDNNELPLTQRIPHLQRLQGPYRRARKTDND